MKYDKNTFLSICSNLTNNVGYVPSRISSTESTAALSKELYKFMEGEPTYIDSNYASQLIDKYHITGLLTSDDVAAIRWIRNYDGDNDYFLKIKNILDKGDLEEFELGIVASFPSSYLREKSRTEQDEKRKNSPSVFVGNIGDTIKVDVKNYELVGKFDTQFGTMFVHQFEDADGNVFIWKTGTYIEDAPKRVLGKVKDHTNYRGVNQTILTRCKLM